MPQTTSWEDLGDGFKILVNKTHKFGTDAFLLASFARVRRDERCLDLGTGCGIIPMLWMRNAAPLSAAFGVDIQPEAIELFTQTIAANGLTDRLHPMVADIKDLPALPGGKVDLISCNPPYKAAGSGLLNKHDAKTIARHEVLCTIDDICRTASRLLRYGGRFCLCQRPQRLAETLFAMQKAGIEPKRIRFVAQRPFSAPWLFLVEGKKGAKPDMTIEPPLIIEGENGFSDEVLEIYHKKPAGEG